MNSEIINMDKQIDKLKRLDKDELIKLLLLQVRNVWRVDGLYFLGIEKRFGVDAATEIDKDTWRTLARIEAKDLMKTFDICEINNVKQLIEIIKNTGWALYQQEKRVEYDEDFAIFKITRCKVQETRLKKGLGVFPCKSVRLGYLEEFVKTINPAFKVEVVKCPPDKKAPDYWCGWRFTHKKLV